MKKKIIKKKIDKLPENEVVTVPSTSTTEAIYKISPFSGSFGRADIDLLRDKVNEIIDFLNK